MAVPLVGQMATGADCAVKEVPQGRGLQEVFWSSSTGNLPVLDRSDMSEMFGWVFEYVILRQIRRICLCPMGKHI